MRDQRAENLAKIIVQYSTKVKEGDVTVIRGASSAEPLILSIYEEVLRAGGLPILNMSPEEGTASFFQLASDKQLEWIAPTAEWTTENADVSIFVIADDNPRALSRVDPAKQARSAKARKHLGDVQLKRVPNARPGRRGRYVAQ
jgi:aminopeptidase